MPDSGNFNNVDAITDYFNSISSGLAENSWYRRSIYISVNYPAFIGGGRYYIEGCKATNTFEWQSATTYSAVGYKKFYRSKTNNDWSDWIQA